MADLYFGLAAMALLAIGLFYAGLRIREKGPRFVADVIAGLTVVGTILYVVYLWDNVLLSKFLPFSNLVIVGNWFPLAAGFLSGLVWHRVPGKIYRKGLLVLSLVGVAAYSLIEPLLGSPPHCGNKWNGDVCLQTTLITCTPACAVTILNAYGISATEREMAELCLTRNGTTWPGLYRGLRIKTHGTPWKVDPFECDPDTLRAMIDGPVILSVQLKKNAKVHSIYTERAGFTPGAPHTVVYYGLYNADPDRLIICDPSHGRECWYSEDLGVLWHGRGMRLVER